MRKLELFMVGALIVSLSVSCTKEEGGISIEEASNIENLKTTDLFKQGNGAPSGAHYNLNIIGTKEKSAEMVGSNGHVIFVPMEGKIRIDLQEGDFAVLDANGTDGVAQFQLPDPGLDPYVVGEAGTADTETDYSVFVRPLGKPGGWSTITTVADVIDANLAEFLGAKDLKVLNDAAELGGVASVEQVGQPITMRTKGRSTFTNVTAQLLTIVLKVEYSYDDDGDPETADLITTVYVRVPIFDDLIENEYWEYDNNGLKLLQVRFYPGVVSDVTDWDDNLPGL
jgi:hypothetical protein